MSSVTDQTAVFHEADRLCREYLAARERTQTMQQDLDLFLELDEAIADLIAAESEGSQFLRRLVSYAIMRMLMDKKMPTEVLLLEQDHH